MERAFWEDPTTRELLLTLDGSFWPICLVNIVADYVWSSAVVGCCQHLLSIANVIRLFYLIAAIGVAFAVRRYPDWYYKHRVGIMLLNRVVRVTIYSTLAFQLDHVEYVKQRIAEKLAGGRQAVLAVLQVLCMRFSVHLPWGLYFPLPFRWAIWLDIVQQALRLLCGARICLEVLETSGLRPTVTAACRQMTMFHILVVAPEIVYQEIYPRLDQQCTEQGPLLLSLYIWWFVGCFWPTFTLWFVEFALRERFVVRRRANIRPGLRAGVWGLGWTYLIAHYFVSAVSWCCLQVLLLSKERYDFILRVLLCGKH